MDVWNDRADIAAKALRISESSDLEQIRKVRGVQLVMFSNEPTVAHAVSAMEGTPPSKRVTAIRRDGDRNSSSVRDDIGVDKENGNVDRFLKVHPDVNRLKLVRFSFRVLTFT